MIYNKKSFLKEATSLLKQLKFPENIKLLLAFGYFSLSTEKYSKFITCKSDKEIYALAKKDAAIIAAASGLIQPQAYYCFTNFLLRGKKYQAETFLRNGFRLNFDTLYLILKSHKMSLQKSINCQEVFDHLYENDLISNPFYERTSLFLKTVKPIAPVIKLDTKKCMPVSHCCYTILHALGLIETQSEYFTRISFFSDKSNCMLTKVISVLDRTNCQYNLLLNIASYDDTVYNALYHLFSREKLPPENQAICEIILAQAYNCTEIEKNKSEMLVSLTGQVAHLQAKIAVLEKKAHSNDNPLTEQKISLI